ncbi:sensor histidine kinase [Kutzneria sp. 744]|nr:sensor histidine kinase [Kutzneria sp. 744]
MDAAHPAARVAAGVRGGRAGAVRRGDGTSAAAVAARPHRRAADRKRGQVGGPEPAAAASAAHQQLSVAADELPHLLLRSRRQSRLPGDTGPERDGDAAAAVDDARLGAPARPAAVHDPGRDRQLDLAGDRRRAGAEPVAARRRNRCRGGDAERHRVHCGQSGVDRGRLRGGAVAAARTDRADRRPDRAASADPDRAHRAGHRRRRARPPGRRHRSAHRDRPPRFVPERHVARISAALTDSAQSEQRLRRFVADASHELRTPLTSIRGFAELYRRGGAPSDTDVERLMARIESEAIRMGLLVEDLLMLARLDQERSLDFAEVDLLVVAADAVHDARAATPSRDIVLDAPHGAVRVIGDEDKLRQVVMNLVTNAVTHTPADASVRVAVRQERTRPSNSAVAVAGGELPKTSRFAVLEVVDTGPGIPSDQGKLVFDRFYRADQARSRASGGSGLGLAITAAILEAHSGRIELLTTSSTGTRFRVLLAPA